MHSSGASVIGGSWAAIAAGVRAQMQMTVFAQALGDAGLLDEHLAHAISAVRAESQSLTAAGVAALRADLVGATIDLVA